MKIRKKERLQGNMGSTYGTGFGVTEEGKTVHNERDYRWVTEKYVATGDRRDME